METVHPYVLPSKAHAKNKQQRYQVAPPTPVPNLDDVQPFMSVPDFVGSELEALLTSQHIQNPYPYPGNMNVLPSYGAEHPGSAYSRNLREHVKHALTHAWKYDPIRCSVKRAFALAQGRAGKPHHGLIKKEYNWATRGKLEIVKKTRSASQVDVEQARKSYLWTKDIDEVDEISSFSGTDLEGELDEFYGPDGTDLRPIDVDSDEGFSEPDPITTTVFSLPDKSLMEEGITPGGIFQDSGISMDEGYAEYSLAHSLPNTAKETTGKVPSDWLSFSARVAPLRTPKKNGPWLGLVGDQKQCEWPGRRQGPYDLDGLRSPDAKQLANCPTSITSNQNHLPAEATISKASVQRTGEISEPVQKKVNSERSEVAPQSSGQERTSLLHGNDGNPITIKEVEHSRVSVGAAQSASEERPQFSRGSIEKRTDNRPSIPAPHMVLEGPQTDNNASTHARHSISKTSFTTPVIQRISRIQQVQVDTPATPETINIHLTPKYDSDMDADDVSDGSLEVRIPNSPTRDTQKGQSALGRYVQETKSLPILAHQNSSTMSIDGSESEEDPLTLTQSRPSQPEGHAGFSKGVELYQKESDAVFTLSPRKASQDTPSPSKRAPIPLTPAFVKGSASFCPITPFQFRTPANAGFDSPGTPTPAPKTSKGKGNSVMSVFRSPKLGSRSPERASPNPKVVAVAPTTPAPGAPGSQGLLFQKARKNERGTKNVLNSLKLSPERGSGAAEYDNLNDYEDELAGGSGTDVFKGAKRVRGTPSSMRSGVNFAPYAGRKVAQTVVVPRVRSRDDENEGMQVHDVQKKKPRRSMRGADVMDVGYSPVKQ